MGRMEYRRQNEGACRDETVVFIVRWKGRGVVMLYPVHSMWSGLETF